MNFSIEKTAVIRYKEQEEKVYFGTKKPTGQEVEKRVLQTEVGQKMSEEDERQLEGFLRQLIKALQ